MIGKPADVMDQLPHLIVGQAWEGEHGGVGRSVADDPEQLSVGNGSHGLGAGEVPRRRRAFKIGFGYAIALFSMADLAGDGFSLKLKNVFPGFEGGVVQRNRVFHFQELGGSSGRFPFLRAFLRG